MTPLRVTVKVEHSLCTLQQRGTRLPEVFQVALGGDSDTMLSEVGRPAFGRAKPAHLMFTHPSVNNASLLRTPCKGGGRERRVIRVCC